MIECILKLSAGQGKEGASKASGRCEQKEKHYENSNIVDRS